MSYSRALEMQLAALRWTQTRDGSDHIAYHELVVQRSGRPGNIGSTITQALTHGDTYYWSPVMCSVLGEVSPQIPPTTLTDDLMPSRSGYFWFAAPIEFSKDVRIVAATWTFEGGWLHGYGWSPDNAFSWDGHSAVSRNLPHGLPFVYMPWCVDWSNAGLLDGSEPGITDKADGLPIAFSKAFARVMSAAFLLIHQRIIISSRARAERHTRKRLAAEGFTHEPLIRVVELRRKQAHAAPSGEHESVDWSHQWIVSGHWRQQWYPSLNAYQPRWIMPYVKGPEDKPLKPPRAKVFAVVR